MNGTPGSYRDLQVYRLAHNLAVKIHHFSLKLPRYEMYETGSQIRRASKSVSSNIVEGYGRRVYKAEFVKFLTYAHASCDETTEWLEYIGECHQPHANEALALREECQELSRMLNRFIASVARNHRSEK